MPTWNSFMLPSSAIFGSYGTSSHGGNTTSIKRYDYTPIQFNKHTVGNEEKLYLGVELEVDSGGKSTENASTVEDIMGKNRVYCMYDGSLRDGFEIVTHPMTYQYHLTMNYRTVFDILARLGYKSHNTSTCGMHVHINRDYFGESKLEQDMSISKILYLFEKFHEEISIVARRGEVQYSRKLGMNSNESPLDLYSKAVNGGKYKNVNLQHPNTIEIRVFKGTLNYDTFIHTLKFVYEIARISKYADIYKLNEITWEDILNNCGDDFKEYYSGRKFKEEEKKRKEKEHLERLRANTSDRYVTVTLQHSATYEYFNNFNNREMQLLSDGMQASFQSAPMDFNNITFTTLHSREDSTEVDQLKRKIKSLKRDLRHATGLRKTQLQTEIQLKQRELNLLRR